MYKFQTHESDADDSDVLDLVQAPKCLIFGTFDNHHVQLTLTRALQIENRSAKRNQKTLCIEIRIFCKSVLIVENVSKVLAQQKTDPLHPH